MISEQSINPKEIVDNIEVPNELEQLIIDSVEKGYQSMENKRNMKKGNALRYAAAIIGFIVAGGLVSVPVRALVSSVVAERMEQMPVEEIEEIVSVIQEASVEADGFSRDYTEGEKERFAKLSIDYMQGTFPEGVLREELVANDSLEDELYFARDMSVYHFPQREMTDEELLQIIDFQTKRDYALEQQNPSSPKKTVAVEGEITQEQAVDHAKAYLSDIFGVLVDGRELNFYREEEDFFYSDQPVYVVTFSVRSVEYFYFTIDAGTGDLIKVVHNLAEEMNDEALGVNDMKEGREQLYIKAKDILTKTPANDVAYEKVTCSYRERDGVLKNFNRIYFNFMYKDGSACQIGINAVSGAITDYTYIEDYDGYREKVKEEDRKLADFGIEGGELVIEDMPQ